MKHDPEHMSPIELRERLRDIHQRLERCEQGIDDVPGALWFVVVMWIVILSR